MAATSFTEEQKHFMLELARRSVLSAFDASVTRPELQDWVRKTGACFVTLTIAGQLRGCIGTLEAHRPLGEDIWANARNSAFSDPRFPPVSVEELPRLQLSVSVLQPAEPIEVDSEAALVATLRPGIDGVIVEDGMRRATFLPSVWEQLPEVDEFIAALRRKAGMRADYWSSSMRWYRYTTVSFSGALQESGS